MDVAALPALPLLRGKENLEEWSNLVIQHFRAHGILSYLTNAPREATLRDPKVKAFAVVLLTTSVSLVMDRLTHGGWKLKAIDQDPTVLWNLIQKVIPGPTIAEIEGPPLRSQFATLSVQPDESRAAFISRVVDMRRKHTEFHADLDDREAERIVVFAITQAVNGGHWREWYNRGRLGMLHTKRWDGLMELLNSGWFKM